MPYSNISLLTKLPGAVFLLILLFLEGGNIYSQQTLNFENFTTKDGLLTDDLYNIYQDKAGYLWVFSKFGAMKYNGTEFVPVLNNLPVKEAFIYCIYENKKGQKWVANSNANVYEIRNDSAFLIQGIESMTRALRSRVSEVLKLYQDDSLNFYVLTKAHCYKLKREESGYRIQNLSFSFNSDSILYSVNDFGNEVLVYNNRKSIDGLDFINKTETKHYVNIIRPKRSTLIKNVFYHAKLLNPYDAIRNIKKVNNKYYFAYSNAFWSIDDNDQISYKLFNTSVINFKCDYLGHFWISCVNDGIYEIDSLGNILNHYLDGLTVSDLLFDHQNGFWASTQGMGLFHCSNLRAAYFNSSHPLGFAISAMKILDNALYISNVKGEIVRINSTEAKKIRNATNMPVAEIVSHNGDLLISDAGGSIKKLKDDKKLTDEHGIGYLYRQLFSSGDTLVGVTRQSFNFYYRNILKSMSYYKKKILSVERYRNFFWLGTDDGVFIIPSTFKIESKVHNGIGVYDTINEIDRPGYIGQPEGVTIQSIFKDDENNLWFSSVGLGLYCFDGNSFKNYTVKEELPDNIVNYYFKDKDIIILSANSGLYVSNGWSPKGGFSRWEKIYSGTVFKALFFNRMIYAVTPRGLMVFDYHDKLPGHNIIKINLGSIKVDTRDVLPKDFYKIKSDDKSLEFKMDVISFDGTKPFLNFILKGSQNDSLTTKSKSYRLSQLKPGEYTLTVYPETNSTNVPVLNIPFYIEPMFWQTLVFKIAVGFILAGIIYLIIYLVWRSNKRKEIMRFKNDQLILEYKLIALKAQVNPHFMSNCLSAIQDLIMSNRNDKATYYIAEFGLMVRQILDYSSKQLISLEEELSLVKIYVELEMLRFDNKFVFKIETDSELVPEDILVPPLILNPLIENAIWHGLLPIQNERIAQLHVKVGKIHEHLKISIIDNGAGRSHKKRKISNSKNASYGLKITEQRMTNLNYLYKSETASIVYTDLFDEGNNPNGTDVTITIPMNLAMEENV